MIPFTELRIGNYVLTNKVLRKIAMVSSIEDKTHLPSIGYYIGGDIEYIACEAQGLQPVAITNTLLERCGFLFDNYFKLWQKPRTASGTGMEMELDRDYNAVDFLRRPIVKEIKSMHCLQNLYYALSGKELLFHPVKEVVY